MRLYYILTLLAAVAIMTGCSSSRRAGKSSSNSGNDISARALHARYTRQVGETFDFSCMQSKVRLTMMGKSLNGKLLMERGKRTSLIVNAPMIGFEIGRLEADRDSVTIVDKMDKVYVRMALDELAHGHSDEICLEAVECLMLGRIFIPGRGEAKISDFNRLDWTPSDDETTFTGVCQGEAYTIAYTIGADNQLAQTLLTLTNGLSATWSYSNYMEVEHGRLAAQEDVHAAKSAKGGKSLDAAIALSAPTFPASLPAAFVPTAAYRRVTMSELVEMVRSLGR